MLRRPESGAMGSTAHNVEKESGVQALKSRRASRRLRRESGFLGINQQNLNLHKEITLDQVKEDVSTLELTVFEFLGAFYVLNAGPDANAGNLGFLANMSHTKTSLTMDISETESCVAKLYELGNHSACKALDDRLSLLKMAIELHTKLQNVEVLSLQPQLLDTAVVLSQIFHLSERLSKRAIDATSSLTSDELALVLKGIDQAVLIFKTGFQTKLITALNEAVSCVSISQSNSEKAIFCLRVRQDIVSMSNSFNGAPSLEQTLASLHFLDLHREPFVSVLHQVLKGGLLPLVKNSRHALVRTTRDSLYSELVVYLDNGRGAVDGFSDKDGEYNWGSQLEHFLAFLAENLVLSCSSSSKEILKAREEELELVHTELWAPLCQEIFDECILRNLPRDPVALPQFIEEHQFLNGLQSFVHGIAFAPKTSTFLSDALHELESTFYKTFRNELLETNRMILLDNTPQVEKVTTDLERGGLSAFTGCKVSAKSKLEDLFFKLEERHISAQVHTVVESLYQLVDPSGNLVSTVAEASRVYFQLRETLQLVLAILPLQLEWPSERPLTIDAALHPAEKVILLYNNTEYVQYHLVTILHTLREKLDEPLATLASLDDLFLELRCLGQNTVASFSLKLREALQSCVFDPFHEGLKQDGGDVDATLEAIQLLERQVGRVVLHLKKVWCGIAPKTFYKELLGQCVGSFLPFFFKVEETLRMIQLPIVTSAFKFSLQALNELFVESLCPNFAERHGKQLGGIRSQVAVLDVSQNGNLEFLKKTVTDYDKFLSLFSSDK